MNNMLKIPAYILFASSIALAQPVMATAADNSFNESAEITRAVKLYHEAIPMEFHTEKRKQLLQEAETILVKVIKKNPESLDAHRKLMGVYLQQRDYANGIRTMQNAITLSPEDPKLFIALAILYDHAGAYESANAIIDRALELDPNQTVAREYKVTLQHKIEMMKTEMEQAHGKTQPTK